MRISSWVCFIALSAFAVVAPRSSALAQPCESAADCNDGNECTEDTCENIDGFLCVHSSPDPVPPQCMGCCDTCPVPTGRELVSCCQNTDQLTCAGSRGLFTAGGQCSVADVCEEAPPAIQCPTAPAPPASCRQMVVPSRHRLAIDDWSGSYGKKDRVEWGWRRGESTPFADFGDPLTTTSYALCLYDGNDTLVFGSSIPAGPPWKTFRGAFNYTNRALDATGIRRIALKSRGAAVGRASIRVVGAGRVMSLGNPDPIGNFPDLGGFAIAVAPNTVRMQLINSIGICWEGHYQNRIRRNQVVNARVSRFRAKND